MYRIMGLKKITKSASEEADRLKRLGAVIKFKSVTVNSAQQGDNQPGKADWV